MAVAPLRLRLKNTDPPPVVRNLRSDYGATGNGVTDDSSNLNAMGAAAAADTTHSQLLVFDSGHTFNIVSGQFWTQGITNAVVQGYGATINVPPASVVDYGGGYVAALGTSQHAPINTVARGATSCTLVTSGDASKLTVGDWVCVAGFNVQGGGDPPNLMFYEYVRITGIAGTTVTFDRSLRLSYKSTWQDVGAARLLVTGTNAGTGTKWNSAMRHTGYTVTGEINGGHSKARDVRLIDMTIACFTPTQCVSVYLKNVSVTGAHIEVDKLIELFVARDSTFTFVQVQSAAPSMLHFTNVTFTNGSSALQGTPRNTVLVNSTLVQLSCGCYYGNSKSLMATNCAIASLVFGESSFDKGGDAGANNVQSLYSMSGGVITIPRTAWFTVNYPPWPVPGCVGFFGFTSSFGGTRYGPSFKVIDVTADSTNIYVTTSLAGTWPAVPGGIKQIYMHPCPKLTMTGCTGDEQVVDLSNAPAGAPAGTWSRRTYTKAHTAAQQNVAFLVGRVIEIRVNVTVAHTSALQARVMDLPLLGTGGTDTRYQPVIDCAQVGERVITLLGVTGTLGTDSGLTLPAGAWFINQGGGFTSFTNISATGSPFSCTITIRTDQEAVADDDPDYAELLTMAESLN
jgi:hypothetical protein